MSSSTPPAQRSEPRGGLDRFFSITQRGSTVGREVRGGVATFIAMSYIVVLNPLILGSVLEDDNVSLDDLADVAGDDEDN